MADADRQSDRRVCVGVITGAHGLHGLVRIRPFTEVPEDIAAYGPVETGDGSRSFELEPRNRTGKGQLLTRIEGVDDRDAAEALKGVEIYVPRARLPEAEEDEFYHADLIGLAVVDGAGATLGTVRAVQNFGGGDMLEIDEKTGGIATVPFTLAAVPEVDVETGVVRVEARQVLRTGNADDGSETGP